MSYDKLQYDKYVDAWRNEKEKRNDKEVQKKFTRKMFRSDFYIRTRQTCNIVFEEDDSYERNDALSSELKHKVFDKLLEKKKLQFQNDLLSLSPKMYSILEKLINIWMIKVSQRGKLLNIQSV